MIKSFKTVLAHVFFFGIAGSYTGGLIFLVFWLSLVSSHHNIFLIFLLSPIVGFVPAALTGFLYSITQLKHGGISAKISTLYGFLVMGMTGVLISFGTPTYKYDINYKQSIDVLSEIEFSASLAIFGGFCAFLCAKLIQLINGNKKVSKPFFCLVIRPTANKAYKH